MSLVVPGILVTIDFFVFNMLLKILDFPALGLPVRTILVPFFISS